MHGIKLKIVYIILVALFFANVTTGYAVNKKQEFNMNGEAYQQLALLLSANDKEVIEDVNLYLSDAQSYFLNNKNRLHERGIRDSSAVTVAVVLVDSLLKKGKIIYQDRTSEPNDTLASLNILSGGKLKESACYQPLTRFYDLTEYGIGTFLDEKGDWPSIFECVDSVGLRLIAINEDSDAYALLLVKKAEIAKVVELSKKATINLYYTNQTQ